MTDRKDTQLFAFKLAQKQAEAKPEPAQFKVRDGVSVAGCSGPDVLENYRVYIGQWEGDKGDWC